MRDNLCGVLSGSERSFARKNDLDFSELAGLRIDLDRPRMLLHDDVVSDGQAEASTLASRLCCEEGVGRRNRRKSALGQRV